MKKSIFFLFLCLTLFLPVHAAAVEKKDTASTYTITLNHMSYKPSQPLYQNNEHIYLSLEDLCSLTYGYFTTTSANESTSYHLIFHNHRAVFSINSNTVFLDGGKKVLSQPILLKENAVYVPIQFLELANVNFTYDEQSKSFNFTPSIPYSTTTDTFKDHVFLDIPQSTLTNLISPLVGNQDLESLLNTASKQKQYISFLNSSNKLQLLPMLQKRIKDFPQLEFVFRENDFLSLEPTIGKLTSKPFTAKFNGDILELHFNDQVLSSSNCYFSFTPLYDKAGIDVDETLQSMIMHMLYTSYRDHYGLKDDLNFSPITLTQMGRTDTISYDVYYDGINHSAVHYTLSIYKQLGDGKFRYIIDLVKA